MSRIDESLPHVPVRIAVLTVSDTRTLAEDKSGDTLVRCLEEAGHETVDRDVLPDVVARIRGKVAVWIEDPQIDVILTTGGTGCTGRDVTPEAIEPLFEKHIDGFPVVMHMISYEKIGTSTIQSRSCAGIANGTYIFCLPGSPGACKDAWDGILKWQLDNRHLPCNFVQIIPRLREQ